LQEALLAAKKVNLEHNSGLEFIDIKGGCFQMGCEGLFNGCKSEEKPIHEVCVSGFKIGKFEITHKQWNMVMGDHTSTKYMATDNRPVENIQWKDAQKFISELNDVTGNKYRLPTEAEWEFACRSGGKDEKYCGGNDPDAVAWHSDNSRGKQGWAEIHPVGLKQPNGLGIYDMSGNVAEWVQGCPSSYKIGRQQDPQDLCKSSRYFTPYYVYRGGNAELPERYLRSYSRNFSSGFAPKVGLRLVAPVQ
jgi:formylglycine-generating enzyme required for sulfatase activity